MSSDPKKSGLPSNTQQLLEELVRSGLINSQALHLLPVKSRVELNGLVHADRLLMQLVDLKLLTSYQASRVGSGKVHGLMLGKYRTLDRLGVGDAGVVFRGEHRDTGEQVAIKVLIPSRDQDAKPMLRFFAERKAVGQLSHPGIVRALDVGEETSSDPDEPVLYYYVMEYVPGLDLEQHIRQHGPMQPDLACEVAFQAADALTEADKHHLVHRDIKPANILLTPEGRARLVDFGAVRQLRSRQTEPGSLVGILEWIAPEQAIDARKVDIRADVYSLGCTLFWCLTAQSPYGAKGPNLTSRLHTQAPPSVRSIQQDLPSELNAVVSRMMAFLPEDRFPTPQAVMDALIPFVSDKFARDAKVERAVAPPLPPPPPAATHTRIMIIDADPTVRRAYREALQTDGIVFDESDGSESALQAAAAAMPDLVLLDFDLPGKNGLEVLKQLRENPGWADQKIIMLTGRDSDVRQLLAAGADDYLLKPIDPVVLRGHVKTGLQLKHTSAGAGQTQPPSTPESEAKSDEPEQPKPAALWRRVVNWLPGVRKPPTSRPGAAPPCS